MAAGRRAMAPMRISATHVAFSAREVTPLPEASIYTARLVRFISFEAGNDRAATCVTPDIDASAALVKDSVDCDDHAL